MWVRVLPKKRAGGIGSRTLKGKNNKTIWPEVSTNDNPKTRTTTATHPSLAHLECKVREDAITKQNLRNKIKVLAKRLDCAHKELVMFLKQCDRKGEELKTKVSLMGGPCKCNKTIEIRAPCRVAGKA